MSEYIFTAADNLAVTTPNETPLVANTETVLWTSQEYDTTAEGAGHENLEVSVEYHAFAPDTLDVANQPFNFEAVVVCHAKLDNQWVEIARQFTAIRKVTQGRHRKIHCSPTLVLEEEGIDQHVPGLGPEPAVIKSRSGESAAGNIRFCLIAIDYDPTGPNPLTGLTFSLRGKRFTI